MTISETGRRCGLTGAGDGGPAAQEQLTSPNRPVGPVSASRPESQRTWVPVRTEHTARPGKTTARKATQVRCCCPVSQKTHVCHPATYSYPLGKDYILSQGNKYGCLIVQELNITLIHPTCCETTSAPPASGRGPGIYNSSHREGLHLLSCGQGHGSINRGTSGGTTLRDHSTQANTGPGTLWTALTAVWT